MKIALVDPPDDGEPLTLDLVRRRVASRLAGHRRARQRLAPTPLNLATPAWIDDTSFDIRHHVRLASEPVTDRTDLIAFAGKAMAERLDHVRPLWCMDFAGPARRRPHGARDQDPPLHGRRGHRPADALAAPLGRRGGRDPGEATPVDARPAPATSRLLAAGAGSRMRDLGGAVVRGARAVVARRAAGAQTGRELAGAARHASPRALAARGRHGLRPSASAATGSSPSRPARSRTSSASSTRRAEP